MFHIKFFKINLAYYILNLDKLKFYHDKKIAMILNIGGHGTLIIHKIIKFLRRVPPLDSLESNNFMILFYRILAWFKPPNINLIRVITGIEKLEIVATFIKC